MEAHSSFVSKARTAFHSAAAKAERVFTDLKSDLDSDKRSPKEDDESKEQHEVKPPRWRPAHIGTKQDWQDRFKNIRIGRKVVENPEKVDNSAMAVPFYDENVYLLKMKNDLESKGSEVAALVERLNSIDANSIPPTSVMKQLAIAVEAGKRSKSIKDFLASTGDSSPVRERAALTLSAVKSLVLRDKEDKVGFDSGDEDKVLSLISLLFDGEGNFLRRKTGSDSEALYNLTSFPRDIHGAPPESLVVKLAEVIGSFKTMRRMALFWCKVVTELRRLWSEEQHVPGIPLDEIPDLNSCLLHQQLQVMNCCLSRKRRRTIATESLDSVMRQASSSIDESAVSTGTVSSSALLYARTSSGELVLRLGADHQVEKFKLLETGEPVYAPVTQEGPLLTEDVIRETEEFVLRTGSMGAGCSQLLSDMQAFKAANPGCILEDFVRWHSPPDWTESELCNDEVKACEDGDSLSTRGQLSSRMQKEGNLWRELWETAKPVPAVKQTPLLDEDLTVESILNALEDISPLELFEQLFVSLFGLGFILSEPRFSTNEDLSKLFNECKDYAVAIYQGDTWNEKVDDLCQVYETVETMLLRPEEILKPEEPATPCGEPKSRFKRLSLIFGGKDKGQKKLPLEPQKKSDETPTRQPFANFFDGKSSLFSKKPPKPENATPSEKPDESDWTIV